MQKTSTIRRSSTNPVRISMLDREENLTRAEPRRTQTLKPKASTSSTDSSHIPRPRIRALSADRASFKGSALKTTGKASMCYAPSTPKTPVTNYGKTPVHITSASSNRNYAILGLPTGRRSLSADRASNLGAKGPRKDTRPLTDKAYQNHMLSKIDNYFAMNQCSSMLNSNGSFKPTTLKMLVEISGYLLKMLDIKQIVTITNYVEELPKIAKKLHYPGVMNKSWLKTANAMHSWPNVLGWVCWLVEACEVRRIAFEKYNIENLPFLGDEKQAKIYKCILLSMLDCYHVWNNEKLDEEASLIEKHLQEIEELQGVSEDELNRARSDLEEELIKLTATEENANEIDDEVKRLQDELSSLQKDLVKQENDIRAKEEYLKAINIETEQKHAECNASCKQVRVQKKQQNELLAIVKQQPMSKAEKDTIVKKCTEIQNYMLQYDEYLQEIQKEVYTTDIKLASTNNNLTKAILSYNKEIFVHFSDNVGNVNLEELQMPEEGILRPEIMETLNAKANAMNDLKELLSSQIMEKERMLELNSNELESLQEKMKILEDKNIDIVNEMKELKSSVNKIKTDAKNEEAKLKEQINNLKKEIKEVQDAMPNTQKVKAELKETEDKLNAVRRRKEYLEESARLFFDQFYEILADHRNKLHDILTKRRK